MAAAALLHNEQTCQLLQLVGQDDLRPTFMRPEVWGVVGLWRLRGVCRAFRESVGAGGAVTAAACGGGGRAHTACEVGRYSVSGVAGPVDDALVHGWLHAVAAGSTRLTQRELLSARMVGW